MEHVILNYYEFHDGDGMATKMNQKETKLYEIAEPQHGYFTAKQAASAGFLPTNYTYHVKAGSWLHEGVGIYRLKNFPVSRESQMAFYALWSRNREDQVLGVYSHETALSLYELSDVNPSKLHMSVPSIFRKWTKIPKILKLYYCDLEQSDVQAQNGIRVTTPLRTLIDVFESGTSLEFVEPAVLQAHSRGLVLMKDIKSPRTHPGASSQFIKWIAAAQNKSNTSTRRTAGA